MWYTRNKKELFLICKEYGLKKKITANTILNGEMINTFPHYITVDSSQCNMIIDIHKRHSDWK